MSERIMTLFGEEIVPEQMKAVGKSRAKKKTAEDQPEEAMPAANEILIDKQGLTSSAEQGEKEVHAAEAIPDNTQPMLFAEQGTNESDDPEANTETISGSDPASFIEPVSTTETENKHTGPEAELLPWETGENIEQVTTEDTPNKSPVVDVQDVPVAEPAVKKKKTKVSEEHVILPEDWQGDKKYYSIGEVAELFKVKTSHIRFWTNEFKLKVRTTRKGDRLFTPEQIKELRTIHHLVKERGFTLTGAKAKLKEQNSIDVQTVDLKQSLLQLRNKLVIIKNQLV